MDQEEQNTADQQIEDESLPNHLEQNEGETMPDQQSHGETPPVPQSAGETTPIQQARSEAFPPVPPSPTSSYLEHEFAKADGDQSRDQLAPEAGTDLNARFSVLHEWSLRSTNDSKGKKSLNQTKDRRPLVETIRPAEVIYHRRASVIQNPLLPPAPCHVQRRRGKLVACNGLAIQPGPDRETLLEERNHYRHLKTRCSYLPSETFNPNPAAMTPFIARPNPHVRAASRRVDRNFQMGWKEREERLKDYRDHLLAEEIGYETLVGNLLYIDIPKGRDINRSWENFLSDDVMEWGFPYYKGSKERPRMKQREPYLAHQLKEKLWKYPKTRIFHSCAED